MYKVLREIVEQTSTGQRGETMMQVGGRVRSPEMKALLVTWYQFKTVSKFRIFGGSGFSAIIFLATGSGAVICCLREGKEGAVKQPSCTSPWNIAMYTTGNPGTW